MNPVEVIVIVPAAVDVITSAKLSRLLALLPSVALTHRESPAPD
jgi:hypothetical protein